MYNIIGQLKIRTVAGKEPRYFDPVTGIPRKPRFAVT